MVAGSRTKPDGRPVPPLAHRRGAAPAQSPAAAPRRSHHQDFRSASSPLSAVLLALAASLSWGVGDFIGGFKTRRLGAFVVLFVSQPPTLLLIPAIVIIRSVPIAPGPWTVAGLLPRPGGPAGLSGSHS